MPANHEVYPEAGSQRKSGSAEGAAVGVQCGVTRSEQLMHKHFDFVGVIVVGDFWPGEERIVSRCYACTTLTRSSSEPTELGDEAKVVGGVPG